MTSQRKQINVRIDDETADRIDRVQAAASAGVGLKLAVSDLFRLGLMELERKYPPAENGAARPAAGGAKAKRKKERR